MRTASFSKRYRHYRRQLREAAATVLMFAFLLYMGLEWIVNKSYRLVRFLLSFVGLRYVDALLRMIPLRYAIGIMGLLVVGWIGIDAYKVHLLREHEFRWLV